MANTKLKKRTNNNITWKAIFGLFMFIVLGGVGIVGVVMYYHFDWAVLSDISFYENLANPSIRIVPITEGLRKEQIAEIVGSKLGWDKKEKNQFTTTTLAFANETTIHAVENSSRTTENVEGYLFPKTYMLYRYDDPTTVQKIMFNTLQQQMNSIQKSKNTQIISEQTALTIASIIQREAGGKSDMNLISGIIWNRLFKGMRLQIDATLQYAKGTKDIWWPQVDPKDKAIDSPYNTYKYSSLPPSPISSPGLAAITAAYNPEKTNCLYYLHDRNRQIHCSTTYAGHLKNIARYY